MQQMTTLIENLWVFLIIIIIGYFIGAKKYVTPAFKNDLTFVLLKVTLPLMVVDAVVQPYKEDLFKKGLMTFALTSVGFLVCFIIGYVFMKVFKVEPRNLLAMPIAGNTTLLATEYGGDEEFAAKSTILSSILCIATTPLIFLLI